MTERAFKPDGREQGIPGEANYEPSLGRNSSARLASDVGQLLLGLAGAAITARWLGPADKGTLSALLLLVTLLSYASSAGLGDAAIVFHGKSSLPFQQLVSATIAPVVVMSVAAVPMLWLVAALADWSAILAAVAAASLLVPATTASRIATALHMARERVMFASGVAVASVAVTTGGYLVFIVIADLGIFGGVVGTLVGVAGALYLLLSRFRKEGLSIRPQWDPGYLVKALRYGVPAEIAYLLVAMSQRLDVLLVYALAGEAAAGVYAIAVTLGQLVWYAPFALANAGFPRLATVGEQESVSLLERMSRVSLASALISALVLLAVIPVFVPLVFGDAFSGAVHPALLLTVGGVIWSEQWLLARAAAARGDAGHYVSSFALGVTVMVILDVAFIPPFGLAGAAVAFIVGPTAGLALSIYLYVRRFGPAWLRHLLPTFADVRFLGSYSRGMVRSAWLLVSSSSRASSRDNDRGTAP